MDIIKPNTSDTGKLLLRLAVGGLMFFHGVSKLTHGVEGVKGLLSANNLPGFLAYGLYIAEVIAPILIILGFWTRIAALVIAFEMIMAIALAFKAKIFTVNPFGGWAIELEAFFLLCSLALFFIGSGRYSVTGGRGRWD